MAQQTKSSSSRTTKRGSSGATKSGSSRSTKSGSNRSSTSGSKSSASKRRSPSSRSRNSSQDKGPVEQARDVTVENAQSAGSAVAATAKKLKTPALAAGAGIAGIAGGIALGQRDRRKKVLGVRMPKLDGARAASKGFAEASKHVGSFAEKAGELATEVRTTREAIEHNGKRRSPVEVVLQGLTARR